METNRETRVDWKRILIYCAFAFGIAYAIGLVVYLTGGLRDSPVIAPGISLALILLIVYMLAPAAAHILTRAVTKEGWKDVYLRPRLKKGWGFWLIAWLGTPVLIGFGTLVYFLIFPRYFDPQLTVMRDLVASSGLDATQIPIPMSMLLLLQTLQAVVLSPILNAIPVLGEEFGWRAYLQPKLMPLGPRKAMVLTGVIWGLWHAPIIAMGYNYGNFDLHYFGAPWTGILMMTLATIWLGIFFGWLSLKAGSVWPAVIGHGSLNGTAGVALFFVSGSPLLLLGPSAVGVVGGSGFILACLLILLIPGALRMPVPAAETTAAVSEPPVSE